MTTDTTTLDPVAVGVNDAAAMLGISPTTLRKGRHDLGVPCFEIGNRLLFPVRELREWAAARAKASAA
jgi:hypothetical protein